ncbi:MAG: Uma2 family endonuclease [Verrucomicrobiota bacterium]
MTVLQTNWEREQVRRRQFYEEMMPEQKIEFIDGEVILHSPAKSRHLDVTKFLLKLIDTHVELHPLGTVNVEKCLIVFSRNDYEPDLVFFGKEKEALIDEETMKFPVPDFVVEVHSPSTEKRDRGVKYEDYESQGVQEYWIVDAEAAVVEQYVLGSKGRFELKLKAGSGVLSSPVLPGFSVAVEALFERDKNLVALRKRVA